MTLTQLQFVSALADTASFSKAAQRCFVTQPTLSNAVAQLEEELGGRLFSRTTRKVCLTPLGENLLPLIRASLDATEDLRRAAKLYKIPSHKLIRIGFSPLINMRFLTSVVEPFQRTYPDVEVIFKECFLNDLRLRLDRHALDLAILPKTQREGRYACHPIYEEALYYIPPETSSVTLKGHSPIQMKEVATQTFILTMGGCGLADEVRRLFKGRKLKLHEYQGQALSYKIAEEWTTLGIGATILPKSKISSSNMYAYPLLLDTRKPAMLTYQMMWSRNISPAEHVTDFLKHCKKVAPALMAGIVQ